MSVLVEGATWAALLVPPVVGAYAMASLDRFRRRAFGLYAKGAAALMAGVAAGVVYYLLVITLLSREGALQAVWEDPLGATALMVLVQSVAAATALAFLVLAARRFLAIVEP